ncbi:MAG: thioredoxin domain-containing protein [Myxococcota bacterium]
MPNSSGGPIVLAAVILGLAVMGGAYMVSSSVDAGIGELAGVREALTDLGGAVEQAAVPDRPAPSPSRSRRPDPAKEYSVGVKDSPVLGSEDAKIQIVEFSDFQCPFCSRVWPTLQKVREEYGDQVQLVFKHLPLRIHPNAPGAHAAAEAAHRQGKFWEMHDAIFANQRDLSSEAYEKYARDLGLDVEKFKADSASEAVKKRVEADSSEAASLGVSGTPSFFINGRYLSGAQPYEEFKKRIDEELGKG